MSAVAAVPPRRLRVLLLFAACVVGLWILAGFFATSEFYRRSMILGEGVPVAWNEVLDVQMITAFNWAMVTPLVVLIAQRFPVRPPHRIRNAAIIIVLIPPLAVVRAAMGGAVMNIGEHHPVDFNHLVRTSIEIHTHRYMFILAAIFFVYHLVDAQREAVRRERQRVRAQTLLARTEIDELRARLQPEFALRMLRHIGSVMRDEPKTADGLIVTLSGILRRSMARGGEAWIPLADELEHFDRCLDLCRAGGRFAVTARYVAGDEILGGRVPARILEPVIETVVLDLTAAAGGSVEIRCARERIDVSWTVSPDGEAKSTTVCLEGVA